FEPVAVAFDQVEGRLADGAGRSEDREPACHVRLATCAAAVSTATGTRPSSRSRTPPCPGSQAPESLTPPLRFMLLSNRSPAWAARANSGASSSVALPRWAKIAHAPPSSVATRMPPYSPSTVLPGLIDGASLRRPKRRPTK